MMMHILSLLLSVLLHVTNAKPLVNGNWPSLPPNVHCDIQKPGDPSYLLTQVNYNGADLEILTGFKFRKETRKNCSVHPVIKWWLCDVLLRMENDVPIHVQFIANDSMEIMYYYGVYNVLVRQA